MLYEPDPALIRAGCLAWLCRRLHAHQFDPDIAYLAGDAVPNCVPDRSAHSLVQAFAIEEIHPFALKLLNQRLQALGVARVELKSAAFPSSRSHCARVASLHREGV